MQPQQTIRILTAMNTTTFTELAALLDQHQLLVQATPSSPTTPLSIFGAACDSRTVQNGNLFICKGAAFKPQFLQAALAAGAVAYACADTDYAKLAALAPHTPVLVVNDIRRAMAYLSAAAWDYPDQSIQIAGITGTKGKSTVAYMLRSICDKGTAYAHASIMGSIETYDGIEREESHNTTPEAADLWRHLAHAKASDHSPLIMEVSSQALKYDRVLGLHVGVAGWLNIGQDHISPNEHSDFEDYFSSKLKLFSLTNTAVINLETDQLDRVLTAAASLEKQITYSATGCSAHRYQSAEGTVHTVLPDLWAKNIEPGFGSLSFVCHTPHWTDTVFLSMAGLFNVDNALCAIGMAQQMGYSKQEICEGLAHCQVPGRMEISPASTSHVVGLIDYAHNRLSFKKFFSSVKQEFTGRKIVAVFGCAGGKAYERRQELPEEAAKWCDLMIYTSEDPWNEPAEKICAQMATHTPVDATYEIIVDRTAAIERAVAVAQSYEQDSIVCLLAKGDETRMHRGDAFVPMPCDGDVFAQAMAASRTKQLEA
ncbi:UDP-N-acetylmuramyl-tripeptide synthetase [Atopobium minutum]|uniref:UDP-N-acetylmuramoylalanyl-D-glutamate--2,6-diaminopimelate ligase n=2 Tax=Atopobium minutum TaxID=1381 RepID=A0AB38A6D7_9ACTN|nr:UDP-N-acetylmuramyl-tripeptide synthetase [Atopobium minutum]SEB64387.1 UDP-N-acetylmuramoylalanyl-D-glutamate--2,6-diaminopimelate ligase [Atopobium minutum]